MTDRQLDRARPIEAADRRLWIAGVVFGAAATLHTVDHLRRGQGSITDFLFLLGNLSLVIEIVAVTLVVTRHRMAPLVAAAAGLPLAIGFAAAHWLPHWSAMSDPVWEISSLRWLSYTASIGEIVAAATIAVAGIMAVRAHGLESFATKPKHPPARSSASVR